MSKDGESPKTRNERAQAGMMGQLKSFENVILGLFRRMNWQVQVNFLIRSSHKKQICEKKGGERGWERARWRWGAREETVLLFLFHLSSRKRHASSSRQAKSNTRSRGWLINRPSFRIMFSRLVIFPFDPNFHYHFGGASSLDGRIIYAYE
jgi:hypothetical protein